jgi:DnaJ-domain-containing protein 1
VKGQNRQRFAIATGGEPESEPRRCEVPGCGDDGAFRAPRARREGAGLYWFCLVHIREYNAAWDYFAGMDEHEIERHVRADATWRRPTWPFGTGVRHGSTWRDPFGIFAEHGTSERSGAAGGRPGGQAGADPADASCEALAVMNLARPVTLAEVKRRYKELVKRLHPDANGGDTEAEERLKLINQAYAALRASITP